MFKVIVDYGLLTTDNPVQLSKMVKETLGDGWEPYGSPTCAITAIDGVLEYCYCQAMVQIEVKP